MPANTAPNTGPIQYTLHMKEIGFINVCKEINKDLTLFLQAHDKTRQLTQWCSQYPTIIAGPRDLAGFMLPPEILPYDHTNKSSYSAVKKYLSKIFSFFFSFFYNCVKIMLPLFYSLCPIYPGIVILKYAHTIRKEQIH